MSKQIAALILAMMASACTADGGAGSGGDVLPKRGELAGDPTIVSATASRAGGVILPGSTPPPPKLEIEVDATDPMGAAKLSHCAVTVDSVTEQDDFDEGSCAVEFGSILAKVGDLHVVGITIANEMGGVTTASVTLTVAD